VHFLGFVDDETLRREYLLADVFCQPGTAELQSLVTLEALSASKPVVLADALALPHLVDPGVNGYLFGPGDVAGLAEALRTVLRSDPVRHAMGAASRAMAERHASELTVARFEEIYAELVGAERLTRRRASPCARRARSNCGRTPRRRSR